MAEAYDKNVTPRFEPIAQEVVRLADPKPGELFLDVGTGTGLLACLIAPRVLPQGVVAIDLADGAISVASYRAGIPGLGYDRVFQEVHRVLKPSGRFVFSEWPTDPNPSFAALRELLEKHGTRSPSKDLAQVREAVRLVRTDPEAKALGDPRSVLKALGVAGFEKRDATTKTFPVRFTSVAELVVFAGSYGWYERELREMTIESRKTFDEELAIRLKPLTTSAGIEDTWTLNLFVARSE